MEASVWEAVVSPPPLNMTINVDPVFVLCVL